MSSTFDVIILGLGGMGSAAAAHLAARSQRILGLDQFTPPHDHGSSHGESRVVRQAYFEDPAYVPLLRRAYELWDDLQLLTRTGGLMLGRPDSTVVAGSLRSARQHGLPHELLDAGQIRQRFPAFTPDGDIVALYETNAGWVSPEATVRAHLERAARHGATLQFEERVTAIAGNTVTTTRGRYSAYQLVITAGPWVREFVPALPVTVERQVLYWFAPASDIGALPIWIWETPDGTHPYGLPAINGLVKTSLHGPGQSCTPATVNRSVSETEIKTMQDQLRQLLPSVPGRFVTAKTCLYTTTPTGHFLLDRISPHIVVASPCSGHGFKFCPVIGEIIADLVVAGTTRHDIGLFRFH